MSEETDISIDLHDDEIIEKLITDFPFFVQCLWEFIPFGKLAPLTEIELDMCAWMANSAVPRRGILAPRGIGKTHFLAAYFCWRYLRDPNFKILLTSKSKIPAAQDTVRLVRGWLKTVPFLQHLDPGENTQELATDQSFQFDVSGSDDSRIPSLRGIGIDGQITGGRAHLAAGDDIETLQNTKTVEARQELDVKVGELFHIASFGEREVLYLGTLHTPESVYIKLHQRGYVFRTYPLTYPLEGEKFLGLAPIVERNAQDREKHPPGSPVFNWSQEKVDAARAEGRIQWYGQYQLTINQNVGEERPLKLNDLIVYPCSRERAPIDIQWGTTNNYGQSTAIDTPIVGWEGDRLHGPIFVDKEWGAFTGTKGWIDPSGRGKDLTGLAAIGHLGGRFWVKGLYGLPGGSSDARMDEIARLLKLHDVREVGVETNIDAFDTYVPLLEAAIRRASCQPNTDPIYPAGWSCAVIRKHSTGQKELRIIGALEPVMSSHRMIFHPDAILSKPDRPRDHEPQWMIAAISKERECLREDGPIDALAGCTSLWMDSLRVDPNQQALASRQRLIDNLLQEQREIMGGGSGEEGWIPPTQLRGR